MSFRCERCGTVSQVPVRTVVQVRPNGSILHEGLLCSSCAKQVKAPEVIEDSPPATLEDLKKKFNSK